MNMRMVMKIMRMMRGGGMRVRNNMNGKTTTIHKRS